MVEASFWKRAAAYAIDAVIYWIITYAIGFVLGILLALAFAFDPDSASVAQQAVFGLFSALLSLACYLVYYVWTESSVWQASVGKKLMGLKVTDLNGERISFWRSLGRNVGMIVSGLTLGIGYLMCFWTERKQCLHDKMASCLVVDNTPEQKKGCAVVVLVLWLLGLMLFAALGVLVGKGGMQGVQERALAAREEMNRRQTDMDQIQQRIAEELRRFEEEQKR